MQEKLCTKCDTVKSLNEFYKNKARSDGCCIYCKSCQKKIKAAEYKRNKNQYLQQDKNRRAKVAKFIQLSKNKPCADCGYYHPACMDFHHKDDKDKKINISQANRYGWTIGRLQIEIDKCVVLCSNCHRIRHWKEKHEQ